MAFTRLSLGRGSARSHRLPAARHAVSAASESFTRDVRSAHVTAENASRPGAGAAWARFLHRPAGTHSSYWVSSLNEPADREAVARGSHAPASTSSGAAGGDRRRLTLRSFLRGGVTPRRRDGRRAGEQHLPIDWHEPYLLFLSLMILLLSVADAFLTITLIMGGAQEANPLLAFILRDHPELFAAIKMALTGDGRARARRRWRGRGCSASCASARPARRFLWPTSHSSRTNGGCCARSCDARAFELNGCLATLRAPSGSGAA